ncbi:Chitin synthase, class 7 [Microbotryomycetes sp. JL221]|nr:Chitin synthase, class 7 [Microbotryomycetes sp. JL221]
MATIQTSLQFGSYDWICSQAALIVCPLVGSDNSGTFGVAPVCYARNVELGKTLIFQPEGIKLATAFLHICALIMVTIMILHIRSKYTAVGRKEIVLFFYFYFVIELLGIFLDSAIIPTNSNVYPWFAAVHLGLICATCWCLLVNGFVGFQFAEDGTAMSLWSLRISSLVIGLLTGFFAIATFKNFAGFNSTKPTALWVVEFIFTTSCIVIYIILQFILVLRTLNDRWPIGDIIFGTIFFTIGQVILYGFSTTICDAVHHYIDGIFFQTLCTLFSVMMVYKYWDSITKEDLEFSVGNKQSVWEIKDLNFLNNTNGISQQQQQQFQQLNHYNGMIQQEDESLGGLGQFNGHQQGYPPVPPVPTKYNGY